jgi:subtilisin family serine protease
MGVRVGAAFAAVALVAGPIAAPAVSAEARGEQAWWYTAMKISDAHAKTTGKGVTIALIDDPIAPDVPELKTQDVTVGKNFCGIDDTATGAPADHGTRMAALIVGSGKGSNGTGVAGIAPDATLQTFGNAPSESVNGPCVGGGSQATAAAIDAAVAAKARIINISNGTNSADPIVRAAVQRALAADVVIVAATGQSDVFNSVVYPASEPGVVAVVAVDREAKAWSKNVRGNADRIVMAAPGVDMPVGGFNGATWDSSGVASGTSEATAIVSGGLALVAAKYPKATGNQLIQHLIHNPGGEDREFGRNNTFGYGIISVTKMLESDPTKWPDVNPLIAPAPSSVPTASPAPGSEALDGSPVAAKDDSGGGVSPVIVVVIAVVVLGGGALAALRFRKGGAPG